MGYDLHITRAEHWAESDEHPISQADWEKFAATDPELEEQGWCDYSDIGRQKVFAYTGDDGFELSLTWHKGQIDVAGVRSPAAARSLGWIASALKARLMGDDGETYL